MTTILTQGDPGMAEDAAADVMEELDRQESGEKEHRRELHLFNKIATITAYTLDLQEISNEVLSAVLEFFQIEAGLLLLWDRVRQGLTYAASRGFPQDYLKEGRVIELPVHREMPGRAAKTQT